MGDSIDKLPIDPTTNYSNSDIEMVNALFKNKVAVNKIALEFKGSVIGGILFVILSLPYSDKIIKSMGCNNDIMLVVIKFILFVILFYITQYTLV